MSPRRSHAVSSRCLGSQKHVAAPSGSPDNANIQLFSDCSGPQTVPKRGSTHWSRARVGDAGDAQSAPRLSAQRPWRAPGKMARGIRHQCASHHRAKIDHLVPPTVSRVYRCPLFRAAPSDAKDEHDSDRRSITTAIAMLSSDRLLVKRPANVWSNNSLRATAHLRAKK